ncbi:MAG TPA: SDR family oxidoreductase [candidate division Zixibacteria bacterium]|nr:SDR family oxidoreductase [candidate division Zixibacteria bacterium]
MKTIFITGSSRGLGLEFTKQYLELGNQVIASCRKPEKAKNLHDLKKLFPNTLTIIQLDVTKENERERVFGQIKKAFGSIDILINNAGIISGDGKNIYNLGDVHKEDFMKILQINSLAPLLMNEKFLPLLEKGTNSKIINMSSQNGSITQRTQGGKYSYCTSKAALNMITKILSNDLREKEITILSIQPGWIKTDMGGPEAPLEPKEPISKIIKLVESIGITDTGKFLTQEGKELPW